MDEFTSKLIKKFNFKPKYVKKLKYMYICTTDKGTKLIKPVNYNTEQIVFVHNIKTHLKSKGFSNIDMYYISNEKLPYVEIDNIPYVMTDYINKKECDLLSPNDVKDGIKLIANFHKLSQGLFDFVEKDNIVLLDIVKSFEKGINSLVKMRKKVSKQKNLLDFEISFIKNYDYYYNNALKSLDIINKYNYNAIEDIAKKNIMICHNKLKEESVILGNPSMIINLENITIDHFLHDLSYFISRYIRKNKTNAVSLEELLQIYSRENYIDKDILPILYALVNFPTRYIEICEKFFMRRRNFIPISISSQINDILALKNFHNEYIRYISPYDNL